MNNNSGAWVAGAIVAVLIVGGLIWWNRNRNSADVPQNGTATTTTSTSTNQVPSGTVVVKEPRTSSTVAEVVASLTTGSTFASYMSSTGVSASITGTGPYTVFVPTNAAFGKLPTGTVSKLTAAAKKRLVQYHIVSGKKLDVDALEKSTIQALSKDALNFEALGPQNGGRVNNSIVIHQYNAKNGVVYTVDAVLLPPEAPLN